MIRAKDGVGGSRPGRALVVGLGAVGVLVAGLIVWSVMNAGQSPRAADASIRAGADIQAALDAAGEYASQSEYEKARLILAEAITSASEDQQLRLAHAEALLGLGRGEEAYGEYEAALAIGPRTASVEFQAGTLANVIGRPERAIEHYQAAQAKDLTDPQIPLFLGSVLQGQGRSEEAKAALLRAAKLDGNDPMTWAALGQIALDENNATLAVEHARKARSLEPNEIAWRLIEARALNRVGEPEDAIVLLNGLEGPAASSRDVVETLARSYGMLGRPVDAASAYLRLVDSDPTNADWRFGAAQWLERADDLDRAIEQARAATMLGHEDARVMLERLEG